MEKQLDRLIDTGQRILGNQQVSAPAFWRWCRAVLETLDRFDHSKEDFSQRCNTPQPAHVRNGLEVLRSIKAALDLDPCRGQ
jgi:hypothetical protein